MGSRVSTPACTSLLLSRPQISNLIASEIIRQEDVSARASAIEKWVAVADICRCLHNYNAVLEITSSMNRSAIFRLKKTWLKVSKQVWGAKRAGAITIPSSTSSSFFGPLSHGHSWMASQGGALDPSLLERKVCWGHAGP